MSSSASGTAAPLPPGSGDSIAGSLIAAAVVTWAVAAITVIIRFYTRSFVVHVRGWDDWTILLALLFSAGNSVGQIMFTQSGYGHHVWTLKPDDFVMMAKVNIGVGLTYQVSLWLTKQSILFLYLRVLTYHNARWAVYIVMAVIFIYNTVGLIYQYTECLPIERLWTLDPSQVCHSSPSFLWSVVALHVLSDFIIFALPLPLVTSLTMPPKQKLTLVVLFCLGFFACMVSIIRAIEINIALSSMDFSWDYISISIWTCIEVNIAIVCACLMTLKPLIAKLWPRWLPSESQGAVAELKVISDSGATGSKAGSSKMSQGGRIRLGSNEFGMHPDLPTSAKLPDTPRTGASDAEDPTTLEIYSVGSTKETPLGTPHFEHRKVTETSMV